MAFTTINKATDFFNTVIYSGNGSTQTISGLFLNLLEKNMAQYLIIKTHNQDTHPWLT